MMTSVSSSSVPQIQIQGLCKSFGSKNVLKGVDLEIHKGDSLVIIGGSGTGKSVTLKCLLGLVDPQGGSIRIEGVEHVGASESVYAQTRQKIGMLFQGSALFDSLPVWRNVAFRLLNQEKRPWEDARKIALEKLNAVGLGAPVADLYPSELSGGMQRRVALARAIATHPSILLFDEPTTGLDPITANRINTLICQCVETLGATAVTITHDLMSVRKIAQNVAMIHDGRIIWTGSIQELDHSKNPYVEQFIHGSASGPITEDSQVL